MLSKEDIIPFVSIIIPTYNSEDTFQACLESIFNQDYPKDRFEVIAVDGYSNDSSVKIAEKFPVKVLMERRKTASAARRTGIENATGEFIALIDADCTAAKDWLTKLIEVFCLDEKIAAVGGPNTFDPTLSELSKVVASMTKIQTFVGGTRIGRNAKEIVFTDSTNSCNSAYRKSMVLEVGNFLPDVIGGEELELDWRLANAGYLIASTPHAKINHHKKFTWNNFRIWMYRMGISRACTTKLRGFEALKRRRLSPVSPPAVLLAAAAPVIMMGVAGLIVAGFADIFIAEFLLAGYGALTMFTMVSVYMDLKSLKGGVLSSALQIIGHAEFIYGWWRFFIKEHKSIAGLNPKKWRITYEKL